MRKTAIGVGKMLEKWISPVVWNKKSQ